MESELECRSDVRAWAVTTLKVKISMKSDICEETQGFEMQSRLSIHLKESSVVPFMPCSFLEAWHLGYLVMEMF